MATVTGLLVKLKKERTILRRSFTKLANKIGGFGDEDVGQLKVLKDKHERLLSLNNEIFSTLLESDINESDLEKEVEEEDEYKVTFNNLWTKYENHSKEDSISCSSHNTKETLRQQKHKLKLPKLNLVKFEGDVRQWIPFWGQFSKIHENESIDDHDKFQYLLGAISEGTPARGLIDSFPPSAKNYPKAIEHLTQRYGREELLIEVCMRDLLNLVLRQVREDRLPLNSLYDKLNTQLRALESMGLTQNKYAVMLYPLVESALPEELLKTWERERRSIKDSTSNDLLTQLLEFLKQEVESTQRIDMAKSCFEESTDPTPTKFMPTTSCFAAAPKTNAKGKASTSEKDTSCIFCSKTNHSSAQCMKAAILTIDQRREYVKKAKACTACLLRGHNAFKCRIAAKCLACSKRHNVLFCPELQKIKQTPEESATSKPSSSEPENYENKQNANKGEYKQVCLTCPTNNLTHDCAVTLLQTLLVKIRNGNKEFVVRAMIDSGAQRSYIKKELAKDLGLPLAGETKLGHVVFGGVVTEQTAHKIYKIKVSNLDDTFTQKLEVLDQNQICGIIPRVYHYKVLESLWRHGVTLTDVGRQIPEITLLIGADYCGKLLTSQVIQLDDGLTAVNTRLGWTLQGLLKMPHAIFSKVLSTNLNITDIWNLEALGIRDPAETKAQRDHEIDVMENFERTIKRNEDMRYEVNLPWKEGHMPLQTNKELAARRLHSTTKRLIKIDNYESYENVFHGWEKMGIIEEVLDDDGNGHYLSHHAVIKESSLTTRIRPVFDASAKDRSGNSLNNCLEKGVNLLEVIPTLLTKFRINPVGVTADIEKAFLQISLNSDDRNFLKFLWWKSNNREEMKIYRHCRVVFGLTCSPFLLEATINHHLQKVPPEFTKTATRLLQSFYVDNVVFSLEGNEVGQFVSESKHLMNNGKFNLREWVIAPMDGYTTENATLSVLGAMWNTTTDEIFVNVNIPAQVPKKFTRRVLLSVAQSVFDPIGFTAPTTLIPKLLIQMSWNTEGASWDDELPQHICDVFTKWWEQVHLLSECRIPRRLISGTVSTAIISIHAFSDASQKSFACCIFIRSEFDGKINVQLVLAKARVAPTKKRLTIPRLELMAALIATRLCNQAKEALQIDCPTYMWTDSTVVLAWIKNIQGQWTVFVQNRVKEIRRSSDLKSWKFVPGQMNPADLPSRGCDPRTLLQSKWWEGPQWLKLSEEKWSQPMIPVDDEHINDETVTTKVQVNLETSTSTSHFSNELLHFAQYSKLLRMFCWMYRFVNNSQGLVNKGLLSHDEIKDGEQKLFKLIQTESRRDTQMRKSDVTILQDEKGLWRVQTKLLLCEESQDYRTPVILYSHHPIVERLVRERHEKLCHAGVTTLMTVLRETYWIIGIRRLLKKIIFNCVKCKRHKVSPAVTTPAPLPRCRTNEFTAAFETCGIDYAGPLLLKSKQKAYIVLFTCAVYRAVHFEVATSLSTEDFLMALRRFLSRRGRVSTIYTDNGSNFSCAARLLKGIDWSAIQTSPDLRPIKWIFNPPSAPWWGGWWERIVGSVKDLLRRVLGKASVTYAELETVLCDCEAVINSRPLTYVTESNVLSPITPNNFLHSIPRNEVPEFNLLDAKSMNERVRYTEKLRADLRQRFRSEYLAMLVQRGKTRSSTALKIGDVVLIETQEKRVNWPLGVIEELIRGKDGYTRVARVRTSNGELTRPIQRLYPLEVNN